MNGNTHTNLVSTIIPVRNRPELLRIAVESVKAQTHRPIEIIICDDGSTDATSSVASELEKRNPDEIVLISLPPSGPGPAREAGRQRAKGEFIQYLDSDDCLRPRKFEVQIAALRAHPDCGVAYGRTRLIDAAGNVLIEPYKWTGKRFSTLFPALLIDRWWCTHTPLYRRSVCDAVGPWPELPYSQDWLYDARVGARGTKLAYCEETVSEHRSHEFDRQTGGSSWLTPAERVTFFSHLYDCAIQAGVPVKSAEMRHFSRWVFHHARQCGDLGDATAARECYKIAWAAESGSRWGLIAYRGLTAVLGWSAVGRISEGVISRVRRRPSDTTLKQSWMQ